MARSSENNARLKCPTRHHPLVNLGLVSSRHFARAPAVRLGLSAHHKRGTLRCHREWASTPSPLATTARQRRRRIISYRRLAPTVMTSGYGPTQTSVRNWRRKVCHSRQHEPIEDGNRDGTPRFERVHDDDEIEPGHDEKALAAAAEPGSPGEVLPIQQGTAKPPMIAIV